MNYTQYLQQGGQAASIEERITSLVQAAMQGDQLANEQLNQIKQAAEAGDQKALELVQLILSVVQKLLGEQTETMKCGGKVRAKIKKAQIGNKMEKQKFIKKAKNGCGCTQLKKVGGKLIEVGCDEIPVNRAGGELIQKGQLGWLANKAIRSAVDWIGDKAGAATAAGVNAYGGLKRRVGQAAAGFTDGAVGNGVARRGENIQKSASGIGNRVNSKVDAAAPFAGNTANAVVGAGLFAAPVIGAANAVGDIYMHSTHPLSAPQAVTPAPAAQAAAASQAAVASPAIGSAEWEAGLSEQQKENLRRQKLMQAAGIKLRGKNNGADGLWGASSQAGWDTYLQTHNEDGSLRSRINQKTGQMNEGWRGMSDQDLMNYKGKMFDLSDEELQRRTQLLSGERQAIANNTMRNGDEYYVNGQWVDYDNMQGVTGRSLPGQSQNPRVQMPPQRSLALSQDYSAAFRKQGGSLNYAQYLNLK